MNYDLKVIVAGCELSCNVDYTPSSPDVWYLKNGDPGHPGDDEECIINSVYADGNLFDLLDCKDPMESIYDACCEAAQYLSSEIEE